MNFFKYYDKNNNFRSIGIFSEILYDFHISTRTSSIAELYIKDLHKPCTEPFFDPYRTKTENLSDGSRRAFSMPRKTNETHRFVSPRFSLNFFGHRHTSVYVGVLSPRLSLNKSRLYPLIFFNESKVFVGTLSRRRPIIGMVEYRCPTN